MIKKRLLDIDIAIALSIVLVVYGHLLFDSDFPLWYMKSRAVVYNFHMPLFMFFSGFLMALSYKPILNKKDYFSFLLKKGKKFIPAYLFFSLVFCCLETFRNGFTIEQLKVDVLDILFTPSKAPAGFLWYIYVLLQYYVILPLIMWLEKKHWVLILTIGIILHLLPFSSFLNLDLFSYYFIFIALGILAYKYFKMYYKFIVKFGWIFLLAFLIQIFTNVLEVTKLVLGLLSIPSIHYIAVQLQKLKIADSLANIGRYTYYIYLMNTLVTGTLYVTLNSLFKLEFNPLIILVLFLSGIFLPIFIYKYIIRKVPILNKLIQ
ncbi:acyltransferase family protein [Psychroserpens jangbogonensis]|uniref:acyltransferase family protein n=1 Tax=Psychroserpens jangbogonensis TaxID=1484460 RepID=UPI00053D81C0|nr:acyltransferase [Psychroserpens jangbogonensis]